MPTHAADGQASEVQYDCALDTGCEGGDGDLVLPVLAIVAAAMIPVIVYGLVD